VTLSPFKHPEKSSIFLGTRFAPLPLDKGKGGGILEEGLMPLLNALYEERETYTGIEGSPLFDSPDIK